jgi:hypothetical protein
MVRVRDGSVIVAYREGMREIFDWRRRGASIGLNHTIPWAVEIHGGLSRARADLRAVDLRAFELTGGAERIRLELGRPAGPVTLKLTGGASELRVERPADVAVRLRLKGGASHVELDSQRLGSASDVTLESPGASAQPDRFDLELTGGASKVTVTAAP